MISFFRRVRRGLLKENKVSTYLLYAIGEILLVVVGILIALQINTANQKRLNRLTEVKYLTNLAQVLASDTTLMNRIVINRYDRKMEGLNLLKQYIRGNYQVEDTTAFLQKVSYGAVFAIGLSFLDNSTFEELVNTGNLQLIENEDIREKISFHYARVKDAGFVSEKYASDYLMLMNSMRPFDAENPDFMAPDDEEFMMKKLKSDEVLSQANLEITAGTRTKNAIVRIKEHAFHLIELIHAEIGN